MTAMGRERARALAKLLLLLAAAAWLLWQGATGSGYRWQWYRLPRYLWTVDAAGWQPGPLLLGLGLTLRIVLSGLSLALAAGLAAALLRLSGSWVGRGLGRVYLEAVRNTPLLIQLFLLYFVLAPILDLGRFTAAVLALGLFEGAYTSEIIRAGILSVARGQWEAALGSGLSRAQTYRHIVLPQAIRRMLPPLTSQGVSLIKDSALVSTIALYDLSMQAQAIVAETFLTFEIWLTVAAIYLLLTLSLSGLARLLERRLYPV